MRLWIAVASLSAVVGCTDLPALDLGRCGNGVVEPALGEDCDGPDDPRCGAPDDLGRACRRLCDDAIDACPSGSGCGDDGVCRAASAAFTAGSVRPWVAADTLVVDANGDGAVDLVGISSQRIDLALGTVTGELTATTSVAGPYVTGAAALGDPTGDGLPDVLVPTPVGVVTLAGDALDGLVPVAQSSFPVEPPGRLLYRTVALSGGVTLASMADGLPGRGALVNDNAATPDGREFLLFPPGLSIDDVVGDEILYTTRLNPTLALEGLIIVPFPDRLWMVRVTPVVQTGEPLPRLHFEDLAVVTLTDTACGSLRWAGLTRVDPGDSVDLTLVTQTPTGRSCIATMLARPIALTGQPVRGFEGTAPRRLWQEPVTGPTMPMLEPLALDDGRDTTWFDGGNLQSLRYSIVAARRDVRVLACAPDGITACELTDPARRHPRDWDRAAFVDLDPSDPDNQRTLVGWRTGEAGLDLFFPVELGGVPVLNDAGLATAAPVFGLRAGDFDGDGATDLAIATGERVPGVQPDDDAVYVAFGRGGGVPTAPILAGRFGFVVAMAPVSLPVADEFDAVDDLLVVAERGFADATPVRGAAVLLGSTSQRMVAPLILPVDRGAVSTPIAIAAMNLDERQGEDLIVLTKRSDGYGIMPFSPDGFTMELLTETPIAFDAPLSLEGALWVTLASTGPTRVAAGADQQGRVVAVSFACTTTCTPTPNVRSIGVADLGPVSSLRAADLDGDGDLDLVGVFGGRGRPTSTVALWRNDGDLPTTPTARLTLDGAFFDAAVTDLDRDGHVDLLVAGRAGVLRSEADDWTWPAPEPLVPRDEEAPMVFIDAPDLDRDGLPDLIIGTGTDRRHPTELGLLYQVEQRAGAVEGL